MSALKGKWGGRFPGHRAWGPLLGAQHPSTQGAGWRVVGESLLGAAVWGEGLVLS